MNDTTAGTTSGGGQGIKEHTTQNAWQASYPSNWHTDNWNEAILLVLNHRWCFLKSMKMLLTELY